MHAVRGAKFALVMVYVTIEKRMGLSAQSAMLLVMPLGAYVVLTAVLMMPGDVNLRAAVLCLSIGCAADAAARDLGLLRVDVRDRGRSQDACRSLVCLSSGACRAGWVA